MPVEIELKEPPKPFGVVTANKLVPIRIKEIRKLIASDNKAREEDVNRVCKVGDVCVIMRDTGQYCERIFHCNTGEILPLFYADYLLFEEAPDIKRVVIAKPGNQT